MQTLINQGITLKNGDKTTVIKPEVIQSWLSAVANKDGKTYIHVNAGGINKAVIDAAGAFVIEPKNQINLTQPDGSSQMIAGGSNGTKLGDTTPISNHIASNVIAGKGMAFEVPVETRPFAIVSQTDFDKLITVNTASKQMYLYQKGQLMHQYAISAGAADTPTPLGQFKILSKLVRQDMRGDNADGSRYFQPNVKWINYFAGGGYAIHGNYWRPASVFGNANTSHGCVSLPDHLAKQVYDWAPHGTTVVIHQ
jgi:lipoprotein-anchoring transpeptidase ErfK/SrfK